MVSIIFCYFVPLGTSQDLDGVIVTERITAHRKERCVLIIMYQLYILKPCKYIFLYCG